MAEDRSDYRANTSTGTRRKRLPVFGSRTDKAMTLPKTPVWNSRITTVVPAFNVGPVKPVWSRVGMIEPLTFLLAHILTMLTSFSLLCAVMC